MQMNQVVLLTGKQDHDFFQWLFHQLKQRFSFYYYGNGMLQQIGNNPAFCIYPVSYTHLDVYKRQIIIMAYMCSNSIMEFESLLELKTLLVDHGWTWLTAICTMLFCLMHWPCSTTCFTIKKESKSWKWTIISFLTPTLIGMACCFVVANISRIFVPGI